jgi:hypothetical protein
LLGKDNTGAKRQEQGDTRSSHPQNWCPLRLIDPPVRLPGLLDQETIRFFRPSTGWRLVRETSRLGKDARLRAC